MSVTYQIIQQHEIKNQINNKASDVVYKSIETLKIDGVCQGVGNGGTHWCFISIPMMQIV